MGAEDHKVIGSHGLMRLWGHMRSRGHMGSQGVVMIGPCGSSDGEVVHEEGDVRVQELLHHPGPVPHPHHEEDDSVPMRRLVGPP